MTPNNPCTPIGLTEITLDPALARTIVLTLTWPYRPISGGIRLYHPVPTESILFINFKVSKVFLVIFETQNILK